MAFVSFNLSNFRCPIFLPSEYCDTLRCFHGNTDTFTLVTNGSKSLQASFPSHPTLPAHSILPEGWFPPAASLLCLTEHLQPSPFLIFSPTPNWIVSIQSITFNQPTTSLYRQPSVRALCPTPKLAPCGWTGRKSVPGRISRSLIRGVQTAARLLSSIRGKTAHKGQFQHSYGVSLYVRNWHD